jgi:zinc transport system substrate-binding protein
MRKMIIIGLLTFLPFWHHACSKRPSTAYAKPKVATTIFPLYDITRNIAGDKLEVLQILPPGTSPHTYELTPQQVKRLQGVVVVFGIGHGLDDWTSTIVDVLPGVKRVIVDRGISLKRFAVPEEHEADDEGHQEHEGANPHYWLSIDNGKLIAKTVAEELMRLDPDNGNHYRTNLDGYLSKLDAAKEAIEGRVRELPRKKMITFHDAWAYFAQEFGLEVVGAFEPFPGKQPTPRHLAALHETARRHDMTVIFSEPQFSSETVASFVKDMGLRLYVLDPLGGVDGRDSYIGLLKYDSDMIVEALSHE